MSEKIFTDDPLLLKTESQADYGRILLHNLLIARPSVSGVPELVELHKFPAEQLVTRMIYDPPEPTKDLRERYFESRKHRTPLLQDDIDDLRLVTMAADGAKTERRVRDIVDPQTQKVKKKKFTKNGAALKAAKGKIQKRLRIAAIGFRVRVSKMVENAYLGEDLCMLRELPTAAQTLVGLPDSDGFHQLGRTTLTKHNAKDKWTSTVCSHLGTAVANGSHIIALPEFALPPAQTGFNLETDLRNCSKPPESPVHDHFVFAGSRHEGGSNRGMLFHLEDKNLQGHTHWHYKVASARALGENVLGPYSDEYPSYIAKVDLDGTGKKVPIQITVAICYDSFDPSTFLALILHSAARSDFFTHQIILVPSFNPSSQFVELLRDLSFLTLCTVIYVNSLHGDAKMFVAGFAISDLHDETSKALLANLADRINQDERLRDKHLDEAREELGKGDLERQKAASDKARMYRQRAEAMSALYDKLDVIEKDGGLNHLITVENCDACANGTHDDSYGCASDILYYNIDQRLLAALTNFRRHYFGADESFLPEPYRLGSLEKARANLDKRVAIRKQQKKLYMKMPTDHGSKVDA